MDKEPLIFCKGQSPDLERQLVFISRKSKAGCLVIRDIPIVLALTLAGLTVGLFAIAYNANQSGDVQTKRILIAIGIVVVGLSGALLKIREYTFRRTDAKVTICEIRIFRRNFTSHLFGETAQAELVITKDDENDDFFQAFLAFGDGQSIELDGGSSFARSSARIVFACNAWLHQNPVETAS